MFFSSNYCSVTTFLVDCECWISRSKSPSFRYNRWGGFQGSPADAFNFRTSSDVILRGYYLWNNGGLFPGNDFRIELYQGNTSIAAKNGTYDPSLYRKDTFAVFFPRVVHLEAGVNYTAVIKVQGSRSSRAENIAVNNNFCAGVNVIFEKSSLLYTRYYRYARQISALIFLTLKCWSWWHSL